MHHQAVEVLDRLRQHGLVIFLGARGTGKTDLAEAVRDSLPPATVPFDLDARRASSLEELLAPVTALLGGSVHTMRLLELPDGTAVHVSLHRSEALFEAPWIEQFQDVWRALVTSEGAPGRLTTLILGRPQLRRVLGGDASPLANVGCVMRARPVTADEVAGLAGVDRQLATAVVRKTGGHPRLTRELCSASDGRLDRLGSVWVPFTADFGDYFLKLLDDHGAAAPNVVSDIVRMAGAVSESALLERHFPSSREQGASMLDDLAGSGILARTDDDCYVVAAEMATAVRARIAPPSAVAFAPPDRHPAAAGLMYEFENGLRVRVAEALNATDRDWWNSRVPTAVSGKAESRRSAERESPAEPLALSHPIFYLELGELADIVKDAANWRQVFGILLSVERGEFDRLMGQVARVRNKIAHNRPVGRLDLDLLRSAAERLGVVDRH